MKKLLVLIFGSRAQGLPIRKYTPFVFCRHLVTWRLWTKALACLAISAASVSPALGDTLYLTTKTTIMAVDTKSGTILNQWNQVYGDETAIAVTDTIRTIGNQTGLPGAEYTLEGKPTGNTYTNSIPAGLFEAGRPAEVPDGTSDGTHNYVFDVFSDIVFQTNLDYTNPVALFNAGGGPTVWNGITYDPENNSLWMSQGDGPYIWDFDLSGQVLARFQINLSHSAGMLAFDPRDGTLWADESRTSTITLAHLTTTGTLLGTINFGLPTGIGILGGEFAERAPEPSSLMLLMTGLLGLAGFRAWSSATISRRK